MICAGVSETDKIESHGLCNREESKNAISQLSFYCYVNGRKSLNYLKHLKYFRIVVRRLFYSKVIDRLNKF